MRLFRFQEEDTGRFALTRDAGGARLPVTGAVWRFVGATELAGGEFRRIGVGRAVIVEALLRKGCFVWPDDAS